MAIKKKPKKKAPAKPVRKSPELVVLGRIAHSLDSIQNQLATLVMYATHPLVAANPTAPVAATVAVAPAATEGAAADQTSASAASEPSDAELLS